MSTKSLEKRIVEGFGRYKPPKDADILKSYLDRERESASPDQTVFDIPHGTLNATNSEEDVQNDVWELIAKKHVPVDAYCRNSNVAWSQVRSELREREAK